VRFILLYFLSYSSQLFSQAGPYNPFPALPHVVGRELAQGTAATCMHWFTQCLISHHFHIYTFSLVAMLHPIKNTFILPHFILLCSHKIEFASQCYCFANSFLGNFFSLYKFVAKMKPDSTSGSLPWGSNFCKVPQFEPAFKISSNFLRVLSCWTSKDKQVGAPTVPSAVIWGSDEDLWCHKCVIVSHCVKIVVPRPLASASLTGQRQKMEPFTVSSRWWRRDIVKF
jgi:hypothetical protein